MFPIIVTVLSQPTQTCIGEFLHTITALDVVQLQNGQPVSLHIALEKPDDKSAAEQKDSDSSAAAAAVADNARNSSNNDKREVTCRLSVELQLFRKFERDEVRVLENLADWPSITQGSLPACICFQLSPHGL